MTCCWCTRMRCRAAVEWQGSRHRLGRHERQDVLDKVAATLLVPPRMHLDQLIEIDSPEPSLPRLSGRAEITVLGQDHRALSGHMVRAYGQHGREHDTTPGGGSASRLDNLATAAR
jgi:hypothetical protein